MRGASSRAVTPPPSPASRRDARAGSFRDHQHMHLTPDTETERFIKPDRARIVGVAVQKGRLAARDHFAHDMADQRARAPFHPAAAPTGDRKSVGSGKSVSVRVDLGGRRRITKTKKRTQ